MTTDLSELDATWVISQLNLNGKATCVYDELKKLKKKKIKGKKPENPYLHIIFIPMNIIFTTITKNTTQDNRKQINLQTQPQPRNKTQPPTNPKICMQIQSYTTPTWRWTSNWIEN